MTPCRCTERKTMSNKKQDSFMLPYKLAGEIDKHFNATPEGALDQDQYVVLVETLQVTGSERNQRAAAALFMTLPKEEVIRRSNTVLRLDKLLKTIKHRRNDLSRTSPA